MSDPTPPVEVTGEDVHECTKAFLAVYLGHVPASMQTDVNGHLSHPAVRAAIETFAARLAARNAARIQDLADCLVGREHHTLTGCSRAEWFERRRIIYQLADDITGLADDGEPAEVGSLRGSLCGNAAPHYPHPPCPGIDPDLAGVYAQLVAGTDDARHRFDAVAAAHGYGDETIAEWHGMAEGKRDDG